MSVKETAPAVIALGSWCGYFRHQHLTCMLMNMKKYIKVHCLILASSLLSSTALADTRSWPSFSQKNFSEQYAEVLSPRISADEAAARVQRQYGGRILAVETLQKNGKTFYRIKVLTRKGIVRVVRIKAGSRK